MGGSDGCVFAFGTFRLDPGRRLLTSSGKPVPLTPKTFHLLLLLVQSGGRAVPKGELISALWPNTFVEDSNLTFQVSMLRKALGEPACIETVPRFGYRCVVPVEVLEGNQPAGETTPLASAANPANPARGAAASPSRGRWMLAVGMVSVVLVLASAGWMRERSPEVDLGTAPLVNPLTAYPGSEGAPSLSPDGSLVAFSWDGLSGDNRDIYVKVVGDGEPVRLTDHPAPDDNPAWSPDGRHIVFQRFTAEDRADVFIMPALGGPARRLAADYQARDRIGWTVDGRAAVFKSAGGRPTAG